jgi:hypothetical protein
MDYGVDSQIKELIVSYEKWMVFESIKTLPELDEKYNQQFFIDKVLIVYAFKTPTMGGRIEQSA